MRRFAALVPPVILAACSGSTSFVDLAVGDCFDDPDLSKLTDSARKAD